MTRSTAVGLGRDVEVLRAALDGLGVPSTVAREADIGRVAGWLRTRDRAECVVFLERVAGRWLRAGGTRVLIPNPEWFPRRRLPLLRGVDHVLCKTPDAVRAFTPFHRAVHLLGFTSVDRGLPDAAPDYGRFLHVAGNSRLKGTDTLLRVWARHPEWPTLTVLRHARAGEAPAHSPDNVELVTRYIADDALRALQNACGVHLCPSVSEGWGHYIVEAMACRAVVVTTDAPPMNDLINAERGITVAWSRRERRRLGTGYHVDDDALEAAIDALVRAPAAHKASLGRAARGWFEHNDTAFSARLALLLRALDIVRVTDEPLP